MKDKTEFVEYITKSLDERIGSLNIRKDRHWKHGMPAAHRGAYIWMTAYEFGESRSTNQTTIQYFPNPQKFLDDAEYCKTESKDHWMELNPNIDLTKGLFEIEASFQVGGIRLLSHDCEDILKVAYAVIDQVKETEVIKNL